MRTALDTNIFSALWSGEATAGWIADQLDQIRMDGTILVCGPVFSELLGYPRRTLQSLHNFLEAETCRIDFDISQSVWEKTGEVFAEYAARRRQLNNEPRRLITDFIIGAHALLKADRLMTLDAARYRKNFPDLILITHAQ